MSSKTPKIFFLGNGPLAAATLAVLEPHFEILFHAHTKADLAELIRLKKAHPLTPAVLASFGILIQKDLLDLFESTGGIINLHPSLLPQYRGPSPIESALLNGDQTFGVSIMKLSAAMDAGPIYYQTSITPTNPTKSDLYTQLAKLGATWLVDHLFDLPTPTPQDDSKATYCQKLDRSMSPLDPKSKTAAALLNQIRAFTTWPKSTYTFYDKDCIIHQAHISDTPTSPLSLACADGKYLTIDELQPAGKKPMSATAFLNGYKK